MMIANAYMNGSLFMPNMEHNFTDRIQWTTCTGVLFRNEKQINKKKSINFQKSLSVIQYTLTVMKLSDKCC